MGIGVDGLQRRLQHGSRSRQALYIQRLRYGAERITPERALGWATKGSAQLIGRDDIGELAVRVRTNVLSVTASFGIAEHQPGESYSQTPSRADAACSTPIAADGTSASRPELNILRTAPAQ